METVEYETEPETEESTEPETEAPALAEGQFNAYAQFDEENAVGENVPWLYSFTTDGGKTFDPCTILEKEDVLVP